MDKESQEARQNVFNQVFTGLASQDFERSLKLDEEGFENCAYRGEGGSRCAIGQLVDDSEYNPNWDSNSGSSVRHAIDLFDLLSRKFPGIDLEFLGDLQHIHDRSLHPHTMRNRFIEFAKEHELTVPELPE